MLTTTVSRSAQTLTDSGIISSIDASIAVPVPPNGPTFSGRAGTDQPLNHRDRDARPVRCHVWLCGMPNGLLVAERSAPSQRKLRRLLPLEPVKKLQEVGRDGI